MQSCSAPPCEHRWDGYPSESMQQFVIWFMWWQMWQVYRDGHDVGDSQYLFCAALAVVVAVRG